MRGAGTECGMERMAHGMCVTGPTWGCEKPWGTLREAMEGAGSHQESPSTSELSRVPIDYCPFQTSIDYVVNTQSKILMCMF